MKENLSYYIKRIFFIIINILKMFCLYLFKFLTFFFPNRKKTDKEKIKQEQIRKKDSQKKENHFLDTSTSLPEDENSIKEWEINNKSLMINNLFSLENIEEIVNKVLKEEFEIDIKKISKEDLKLVNEFKKRVFPNIIHDIEYNKRESKDEIATKTIKIVKEELWERPLLITSNKRIKKEYDSFFPNNPVKIENKEEKNEREKEAVKKEFVPPQEDKIKKDEPKKPTLNLREEAIYRITSSTLVVASIAKEIKEEKETQKKQEIIENSPLKPVKQERQEQITSSPLPDRISPERKKAQLEVVEELTLEEQMDFIELLNQENLSVEQIIDIEQKIEKKKVEQEKRKQEEEKIEQEERMVKEEREKIEQEPIQIPAFEQSIENMERNSLIEKEKEELEDKDYESLEEQIDKMLYELELFYIKNEGKMTKEQEAILKNEKEHLKEIKEKLQTEKIQDIEKDRKLFTDIIQTEEKEGLISKIKEMQLEHQMDLDEELLNKIEDLEKMDEKTSKNVEKKLIKKKMRRAIQAASIASLATLPFIRNRFFFAFSLGLFVQNHLGFLNNIIARSSTPLALPNLDAITNGESALEQAINTNYNNLDMLNILNKQALAKHPELTNDAEYQYYVNYLNNRLNKNYQKLTKKYDNLEKYHKKGKKNAKILKRKENLQLKKDA